MMVRDRTISELCDAIFPPAIPLSQRHVVIFNAYADDSGTDLKSQVVAVGGFLSNPDSWDQLEGEWSAALKDWGLEYFRMSQFAHSFGDYSDWTEDVRRERLNRLIGIIKRWTLFAFGVAFSRADFDTAVSQRASERVGGPYGLAAIQCFRVVATHLGSPLRALDGSTAWFFEDGTHGMGAILEGYRRNKHRPGLRLAGLAFVDKRKPAVQTADILAYELYKDFPKFWQPNKPVPESPRKHPLDARYALREFRGIQHAWHAFGESDLKQISGDIEAGIDSEAGKL